MSMSTPLFREAVTGQPYVEPNYRAIERDQERVDAGRESVPVRYQPAEVSDDELRRIVARMTDNAISLTDENIRHSLEGEEIRKHLRMIGIDAMRKVSETRDHRGVVKLTFAEYRALAERALQAEQSTAE